MSKSLKEGLEGNSPNFNEYDPAYIPLDDGKRVRSLLSYQILDSPSEDIFKSIAEIVAHFFKVPIALISFVDKDRVYYKESIGVSHSGRSVPRSKSPCSIGIRTNDPVIFRYLLEDPCVLADKEKVNELGYKFYFGAQIQTRDGYNIGMLAIIDREFHHYDLNDIAALKKFAKIVMDEIELRQFNFKVLNHLSSSLIERDKELELTLKELKNAQVELDNFLYRASHDLRGPISSVSGLLNLANMDVNDSKALSYLKQISLMNAKMNSILTKLIIIYGIIRNSDGYEVIEILDQKYFEKILSDVLLKNDSQIKSKHIAINFSIDDHIKFKGNVKQIQLIIENLVENSIQYHLKSNDRIEKRESIISIIISELNNEVTFEIYDNGTGIPKEFQNRVFDMFFRASANSGSGLGLYIVKKIVDRLKGTIEIESKENEFSKLKVQLNKSTINDESVK